MNRNFFIVALIMFSFVLSGYGYFRASNNNTIEVMDVPVTIVLKNGVYQPGLIQVPAGKILKLHFLRVDNGDCAASVLFPQLNVAYSLPFNQVTEVDLPPQKTGEEVNFTCHAGSYHGKLLVT